ncbi:O-antigen ligase family protein [Gelidibacter gilvus]|uniref:O-antigen ligase-related domain-containing protein n=1 Tax=Gelidibacter gilvus TaxID=59602 RepID=A0A4Q0XDM7_9FLAO|nr:O-antigen ligase family protein [Gelidibacter gilvus]RXJ45965.1 hypothetical protein ESZ48_14215 [Gelidibacter gilvus]
MKILRIVILALVLWNLPSIALATLGPAFGSSLSFLIISLLALYYFLEEKTTPNWWILLIAFLYFTISSFQYDGETKFFINNFVKYFVLVIGGYELIKRVSKEELFYFILLGSLSIGIETIFFPIRTGRYAGFYLNPNVAGFICIYGYALTYGLKNLPLKLFGQFIFTLMGLLTFSRTFIVIWVLLNLISLKISIKNIRILGVGVLIFSSLLVIDDIVGLNNPRFTQLKNIINNENVSNREITEDSRTDTWALHYDKIYQSPIFGNGYDTFSGEMGKVVGVHNTYLLIIGEGGIIPFLLFLGYFIYLFYWSIYFFKETPYLIMQTIALSVFLLANHNFFNFYYLTLVAMWIQYQIVKQKRLLSNTNTLTENINLKN